MSAPKGKRPRIHPGTCSRCREPFLSASRGTFYCSQKCARDSWREGITIASAPKLGPAKPLISEDVEAKRRRALDAAMSGVLMDGLRERFDHATADWAYQQAKARGAYAPVRGWHGLMYLPAGLPV